MIKADTRPWMTLLISMLPIGLIGIGWTIAGVQTPWLFMILIVFFNDLRKVRDFKQTEERRQSAASQEAVPVPFALAQPQPQLEAILRPWIIRTWPTWLDHMLLFPFIFGLVIFLPFLGVHPQNPVFPPLRLLTSLLITTVVAIAYPLTVYYQRIVVTEEGMSVCTLFQRRSVRWHDVRLFAIDENKAFLAPLAPSLTYELSSAGSIVRWGRDIHALGILGRSEEYHRQMEALLSFIGAKTHLPLSDLRLSQGQVTSPQ